MAAPLAVGRILGITVRSQLRGITRPLVTTTVILGAAYVVAGELAVDSWLALLLGVVATVPVAALLAVTCGLDRPQRRQVVARARELARQARRSR